jgi:hypothetical protein
MLCERVTPAFADDDVIEYEDVHEGQQVFQAAGNKVIRRARLEGAGWVVMRKNHRRRVVIERLAQHISWMDLRAVDRSAEEFLEGDEAAAIIEVKAAEDLVIETPQAQPQEFTNLLGPR